MNHTGIQYRSNFARQLQQSEDIQIIPKYHQQQPPALQYRQCPRIENIESDAIDHSSPQAIAHAETSNILKTEQSKICHKPKETIVHIQPPSLQYSSQPALHHLPNQQYINIQNHFLYLIYNTNPYNITNCKLKYIINH